MKICTGDTVVIITGKDKGKTGQVLRVLHNKNRIVVADANIRTRHMKARPNQAGEIVKYEASIEASNVMLVDPKTKKRSRISTKSEKGRKVRVFTQSGDKVKKTAIAKKNNAQDAKESKDTKGTTKKAASTKKTEAPTGPDSSKKSPFWKKMGFGADEMEGADTDTSSSTTKEDRGGSDQAGTSTRSSQRGS